MIFIMLLLLMLIFCSYALLIHLLSLTSYLVIIFLMIIFLWLEIKFFDLKEKNEQKSINRKLRKLFSDYKDDDFSFYIFSNYKNIVELMNSNNYSMAKKFMSGEMYNNYCKEIQFFKDEHYKNIIDDMELVNVTIEDVDDKSVKIMLQYKCFDYTLNRKNKLIRGSKDKKIEYGYMLKYSMNDEDNMVLSKKELIYLQ